jgi:hypothetical protein
MSDRLTRTSIPTVVAVAVARVTIAQPAIVGRHRAQWLFDLATSQTALKAERQLGRKALQIAADAAGRSVVTIGDRTIGDRVFSKASNLRLRNWSQDRNTPV